VAATVKGELVRGVGGDDAAQARDDTVEAFGSVFEVLDYVVGGVGSLYDLLILRKT
jgi:hypothetical protein